jgi:hypothetical protein
MHLSWLAIKHAIFITFTIQTPKTLRFSQILSAEHSNWLPLNPLAGLVFIYFIFFYRTRTSYHFTVFPRLQALHCPTPRTVRVCRQTHTLSVDHTNYRLFKGNAST